MLARKLPTLIRSRYFSMSTGQLQSIQERVDELRRMALCNRELIITNHPVHKKILFNEYIGEIDKDFVGFIDVDKDNLKNTISKVATNIDILENYEMDNRLRIMDLDRRDLEFLPFKKHKVGFEDLYSYETLNKRLNDLYDYSNASREAVVERRTLASKITDWITKHVYEIDNTKFNL